ncbi:MAG TPA: magnesium protoporphyrin IX methyltransferase [Myxococcota bacterium]|nr:magnesium protoporphyrin IX methyltransferase [Myxococcota bacterium]
MSTLPHPYPSCEPREAFVGDAREASALDGGSYETRRGELENYFDRTAVEAWSRLTSTAPVGRIRATVRAGRDEMRETLLSWLPPDLRGLRLLDAGCGTAAFAVEAARRGADVVAVDLSPKLVELGRDRMTRVGDGRVELRVGDMLDPGLGTFDHVVAMDSMIHYAADDLVRMLSGLASRTGASLLFTFAPRTPGLALMHSVGRLFPRSDRAPAIEPLAESALRSRLETEPALAGWRPARSERIARGFYISHAMELEPNR